MADKVHDRLKDLAAFLENEHAVESVEESVDHLQRAVADCMVRSRALAQQATIFLFQSQDPPSLIEFLDASGGMSEDMRKREVSHARIKVLELLAEFVKTFGSHVAVTRQHIVETTRRCQAIARGDWSNKVRAEALEVIISVLRHAETRVTAEDIDPAGYVDKLFYDLKFSKATQTAKGTMLEVIGHVATVFPAHVESKVPQLLLWIEEGLEKQFATNAPEMLLINGLLEALARLLVFDPTRYSGEGKDDTKRQKLYTYLHQILATTMDGQLSRYQVTKSALQFLAIHATMFTKELGANAFAWLTIMKFCIASDNKTVKENAFAASDAVMQAIGKYLASEKDDQRKKAVNRLLKELLPVLTDSHARGSIVAFTLQSLGYLSEATLLYLSEIGLIKIECRLRKFGENLLVLDERATAARWSTFLSFLECVVSFAQQPRSTELDEGYFSYLEDFVVHIMNAYARCMWKSKMTLYKTILQIVQTSMRQSSSIRLTSRIVKHLLLLSLSNVTDHQDMITLYHPETGNPETKLLYEFEDLWVALCRGKRYTSYKSKDIALLKSQVAKPMKERVEVSLDAGRRCILQALLDSVTEVVNSLDLSYQYDLQEARAGTSSGGYKPSVPRDHSIMLNLTEFAERLLPRVDPERLGLWLPTAMMSMFEKTRQLPLVSAFYRITSVLAQIAATLRIFALDSDFEKAIGPAELDCFRSHYASFVRRTVHDLRFYKDELLVATSGCVLSTPIELLRIEDFATAIVPALLIGKSYIPAAEIAISSLENWQSADPRRLESIFDCVIPCLAVYLEQGELMSATDDDLSANLVTSKDVAVKEASGDSDWGKLQRRVVKFLGKCGGKAALLLSQATRASINQPRRGFSSSSVSLQVKLDNLLVDLSLDSFYNHLGHLATESTDRRVKAAACEVYHALVCYLCGKTATHPHGSGSKSDFYDLWKEVFPVVISLATDAEKIARSLFEPLLFQVTRWLCHGSDIFLHEFAALTDELLEGLSHETNTAIREISGKCLSTSLTSAVESGRADRTRGLKKAEVILQRLFSLCRHPGPAQRIGAATTISYFLRTLGEDDVLVVQTFGLRCLKNFLYSLKLCGHDTRVGHNNVQILEDMITKAISKLQRAILRHPAAFTRLKNLEGSGDNKGHEPEDDLPNFVEWIFRQCASREIVYRATCRQLFLALAPLVSGSNTKGWLEAFATKLGSSQSIHTVLAPIDRLAITIHTEDVTNWNLQVIVSWLDQIAASLECYMWCSRVLATEAHKFLFTTTDSNHKRKPIDSSSATDIGLSDAQLPISWATLTFFKQFEALRKLQQDSSAHLDFDLRLALRRSILRAMAASSDFLVTLPDEHTSSVASEILRLHDSDSLEAMSRALIDSVYLGVGHEVIADQEELDSVKRIEQACRRAAHAKAPLTRKLEWHGSKFVKSMVESVVAKSLDAKDALTLMRTANALVECGVVSTATMLSQADDYVQFAVDHLNNALDNPIHRLVAVEAMKMANYCGWNVVSMFHDKVLERNLSPIYKDLLNTFTDPMNWDRVVRTLLADGEAIGPRLVALLDLLKQVRHSKAFPPRSSQIDSFIQTLAPHLEALLPRLSSAFIRGEDQLIRLYLEILLETIPFFSSSSTEVLFNLRSNLFTEIRKSIVAMISRRDLSHFAKGDCLAVLAGLGPSGDPLEDKLTLAALSSFVIDEFPITSTDVTRGSRDYDIFHMLFIKLLSVVEGFCQVVSLQSIYFALKEGETHLFIDEIRASLGRLATAISTSNHQAPRVSPHGHDDFLINLTDVLLDSGVEQNIRKMLLDYLFVPLLEFQSPMDLRQYYLAQAKNPSNAAVISKLATIVASSGEIVSSGAFLTAAVAFTLVEVLYRLVDPDHIRGDINNAFLGHANGKGREFTMLVCKCASKFVTKSHDDLGDHTRFACWKAYNCLLTAVSRTQKQEKFFDQILFQESVWINIIDVAQEYELPTETKPFDRVPLSRFSATTLRQQQRQQRGDVLTQFGGGARSRRITGRNSSSTLRFFTGSSLSQDSWAANESQVSCCGELAAREAMYEGMEIELDSINDHPCMIPLLRVLKQMKADFGDGWNHSAMPPWMKKIHDVISTPTSELNVRLFIVKVVLNVPDVFVGYCQAWASKMMETLLEATVSTSSGKPAEFHYLLRDFCELLVDEWKDTDISSSSTTANRFVNELIQLAPNEDHNLIMQDNLMLVSQLILLWKSHIRIDTSIVSNQLLSHDEDSRRDAANRYTALQVISAMLSAGLAKQLMEANMYSNNGNAELEDGIIQAMEHKRPSIYNVAAEVSGVLLADRESMLNVVGNDAQGFRSKLLHKITEYYSEEDFGRFLALLRSVSLHDCSILDSAMLHRLSFVLPKVIAIESWSLSAVECLENASKNSNVRNELFTHCQTVLGRFLSHRNSAVQLHAARFLEALMPHLEDEFIARLVDDEAHGGLELFRHSQSQRDPGIRRVYVKLAISFYQKPLGEVTKEQIRVQLLRSLADSDRDIRELVQTFWRISVFHQSSCSDRLVRLFRELFSPRAADEWVLYAANLLLDMNVASDGYDEVLFQRPVGEGEFQDAQIDSAWESKFETMTPLFSVEADKLSAAALIANNWENSSLYSPSFSLGISQHDAALPSQSQLISSNLATSQEWISSASLTQGAAGSLQDGQGVSGKRQRRFVKRHNSSLSSQTDATAVSSSKNANQAGRSFFQERYSLAKKNEEATRSRQRKARAQQVIIRRKYRVGDYPDIQIKLLDIIQPLMGLCEMHEATSSLVLASLIPAIVTSKEVAKDVAALHQLGSCMDRALVEGQHSLVFVGTVHLAYFSCCMKDSRILEQLGISYKTVGLSSLASGSILSGELLLEEYLNLEVSRTRDEAAECWDQLYKVLSANQKTNLLVALASRCCTIEDSRLALQAQLAGDFPGAVAAYRKAESVLEAELEMQPHDSLLAARFELRRSMWERFGCLETLNHWDKLKREFLSTSDGFGLVWQEEPPYLEQGVGHCLRSLLGLIVSKPRGSIEDSDLKEQLRSFIANAQSHPHHWELLMSRFGVEISLASIASGDNERARVEIEQVYGVLLKRWSATSRVARLTRLELLQNLSSAVEIDEALVISSALKLGKLQTPGSEALAQFVHRWSQTLPSLGEGSMKSWSQFYMVQGVIRHLIGDIGKQEGVLSVDALSSIQQDAAQLMLQYAGAGVQNDILALASKYLKDYRELCNEENLPKVSVLMVDVFVSHVLKLAERQAQKTSVNGERLTPDAISAITRYYQTSTKMFDNSDILVLMEKLPVADRVAMGTLEAKTFATAAQFYMNASLAAETTEEYFMRAFDIFQRSSRSIPQEFVVETTKDSSAAPFARCRTTFIEFLVDVLFSDKSSDWTAYVDRKTLVIAFMENVLGGMTVGDQECANYFPQLCEVVPAYPDVVEVFEKRVLTQIPIWTCLRWSSQLLALVNGKIGSTIVKILEKIAAEYPVSLFYDFKITFGDATWSTNGSKVDLSRLSRLVSNPVMEKFVDALRLIHHPELRLKEGLRELAKLVDEGKAVAAKAKVAHIWQDCFASEHARLGGKIGNYNRDWARRAKRDVEKLMGRDGSNLTPKAILAAREWITNNFNVMPGRHGITKDMKARLADFADWLEEFDHATCRLELPGQYTTRWCKPDPSGHVHILSIHSTLGVLVSKQLPKQITFHCSDQNDYTFLVKGGEDLRLDQRIEQLFDVMNQILASDPRCRDRDLRTKTYKVIPMTPEIGMIEWLHGTSTLKSIIEKQLQQDSRCLQLQSNKRVKLQLFNTIPAKQYETFLMKQRGSSFAAKVAAPSRDEVIANFDTVQDLIPRDLLRRQLLSLGADFEDFILIRDEFASSLAVFNACSYIPWHR